jgi:Sensors of blue-light using FAD
VRNAQLIYKTVFLSVNNPRTHMPDTQTWVEQCVARTSASSVTGLAMSAADRWLCLLEGEMAQVQALLTAIEQHERPKLWMVLMHEPRAKTRVFPQHRLSWRNDATPLEMGFFLSDVRRHASRAQVWHTSVEDALPLVEF